MTTSATRRTRTGGGHGPPPRMEFVSLTATTGGPWRGILFLWLLPNPLGEFPTSMLWSIEGHWALRSVTLPPLVGIRFLFLQILIGRLRRFWTFTSTPRRTILKNP